MKRIGMAIALFGLLVVMISAAPAVFSGLFDPTADPAYADTLFRYGVPAGAVLMVIGLALAIYRIASRRDPAP